MYTSLLLLLGGYTDCYWIGFKLPLRIAMALGGRAAEEIFVGRISTGASDDLDKVDETTWCQMLHETIMYSCICVYICIHIQHSEYIRIYMYMYAGLLSQSIKETQNTLAEHIFKNIYFDLFWARMDIRNGFSRCFATDSIFEMSRTSVVFKVRRFHVDAVGHPEMMRSAI